MTREEYEWTDITQNDIEDDDVSLTADFVIDDFDVDSITDSGSDGESLIDEFEFVSTPEIIPLDYDEPYIEGVKTKPLLIGCSGGGGHIAAITAFSRLFAQDALTAYLPVTAENKKTSLVGLSIFVASYASYSSLFKKAMKHAGLPLVPEHGKLSQAKTQLQNKMPSLYIDMLLHVYKTGFDNAAIWNTLQREEQKDELIKLIQWQTQNDRLFYNDVRRYFLNLLIKAHQNGTPYTEIISTQALGLPALCDAVRAYNQQFNTNVVIHQYMTDLPTSGAIHFLDILSELNPKQQKQMKLYGVGMEQSVLDSFFKKGCHFQNIYDINPKTNPMVRSGFRDPNNDNSAKFDVPVTLTLKDKTTQTIKAHEKIASIMLGSQASLDTCRYVEALLLNGMDKVYVFGGSNPMIKNTIETTLASHMDKIILLDNQEDDFIASLMTRSQILVTRAGGLSVMEQMAMNHHPNQMILLHHPDSDTDELTSGIPWEDKNADKLIETLQKQHIRILKTSPNLAYTQMNTLLVGCGLVKMTKPPTQDIMQQYATSQYILTETHLYYYNKSESLSCIELDGFDLTALHDKFGDKTPIKQLTEEQLTDIARIINQDPHREGVTPEKEWQFIW